MTTLFYAHILGYLLSKKGEGLNYCNYMNRFIKMYKENDGVGRPKVHRHTKHKCLQFI